MRQENMYDQIIDEVALWNWTAIATFAVTIAGILLPVAVAYGANKIAARNGRIPLLEFAHARMVSANKAAGYLSDDLERVTFALENMSEALDQLEWEAYFELLNTSSEQPDSSDIAKKVEEKIRTAISQEDDEGLSDDQKALKQAFKTLTSVLSGLQGLLKEFANEPFLASVTYSQEAGTDALTTKVNKLLGNQFYKLGALSIAGLLSNAASDAEDRLIEVAHLFSSEPFSQADKIGLFFEYDLYKLPQKRSDDRSDARKSSDQNTERMQYILVNSGLMHLTTMYSLLPNKEKIADIFSNLVDKNGDEIAHRYAELTGINFVQLIDERHAKQWEAYLNDPTQLLFVGKVTKSEPHSWSDVTWELYNPSRHGTLQKMLKIT